MSALDPAIVNLLKDSSALIPAVVQDVVSKEVLMLAYMSTESLALTLKTGKATYFSRSRNEIWVKGATSGHFQEVQSVSLDCDGDALLIHVKQTGVACHTGEKTCFHKPIAMG
ncbi:MAG: phosphoribosyl-AMP cyclohydrolase [Actinobacteria bacterium]|uniref:Histidine biosynthesis bifunctional protein HisIE n=1 Tax=freshwater metagenome TaxID=449393 RepID=A0A6J6RCW4_9ZZZZ|nr:phosphoribosyl-AMP cyclohydrolase [Actinomycetota bacterium]MSX71673.1 phosphoribosyl-AMP cyclohydrolase [Actinomycetota bacterium]MSY69108.1 phosphoribosyl-AMP cyclohydrolase [Actinomycetota bacterium]MTA75672.1 phosphoribosyl-AMP cyclohydrolase [Actinomycetota bacterium]